MNLYSALFDMIAGAGRTPTTHQAASGLHLAVRVGSADEARLLLPALLERVRLAPTEVNFAALSAALGSAVVVPVWSGTERLFAVYFTAPELAA